MSSVEMNVIGPKTVHPSWLDCKRFIEVPLVLVIIVALAPLILFISLAVMHDGGPAFYKQTRIGRGGRQFQCWKFRSMSIDAQERLAKLLSSNPEIHGEWVRERKLRHDPRITPIGRWLRRYSFDEIPQLFNVLNGTMSLVGPRPIVEEEIEQYGRYFEAYALCVPGITGLWQVSGRNDLSYKARVRIDALYASRRSFWLDMFILIRTPLVVFTARGAY